MIMFVRKGRASFTLVELLVVIAIIGILTAMIAGVAASALARARWSRIKIEVDNLAAAVEAYKAEFGEYPPDFHSLPVVQAHMQKRYPRWNGWWPDNMGVPAMSGAIPQLDKHQALVYWLRGHSKNPVNPFDTNSPGDSFYDFQRPRLLLLGSPPTLANPAVSYPSAANQYPMYVPDGGQNVPFIYFSAVSYTPTQAHIMASPAPPRYLNLKIPYVSDISDGMFDEWINPRSFQIISAGPDGDWGNVLPFPVVYQNVARYPSGRGYLRGDHDNATNFSVTTLESSKP